jgi:hypothetical protein
MAKLAEFNFCAFSGGLPIDEVSKTTLSGYLLGSAPSTINPLPGKVNRPGLRYIINNTQKQFTYDNDVVDGLRFHSTFLPTQRRTFVFWYYCNGTSHDTGLNNYGWDSAANGFGLQTTGLQYFLNGGTVATAAGGNVIGWHNAVMTIDRTIPRTTCFFDSASFFNTSTVPATGSANPVRIGHIASTREADMSIGYVATYDTILDAATISGIYQAGLMDTAAGNSPLALMSGVVLDLDNKTISGAPLYLIKTSDGQMYHKTTASSGGLYTVPVPFPGNYVLAASSIPPARGARAISLSASTSGTITYYDGS